MKKILILAAALAVVLTVFSFPVVALAGGSESAPAEVEVKTSFIEPDYYPDYDVAPAPMPAPEKAPKTGDFSMLPQLMLAVAAAGSLVVASKRAK